MVYGDSAYTDYNHEQDSQDAENIKMMIARKSNSKRKHDPWQKYLISVNIKGIEIMFSQISVMFPKRIHAVSSDGLLLKLILFIFVFTLNEKFI